MNKNEFIEQIGIMANENMKKTGILASLTIAQACLESNYGQSSLSKAPNYNLFGIKGDYKGQYCTFKTTEYINGKAVSVNANFRKYPSWLESLEDHSSLFNRLDRYSNLRGCTDYKLACKYVREDGYATDPNYTNKLINIIETYNLSRFDNMSSNDLPNLSYYKGTSIVEALNSVGYDSSFDSRKKLAASLLISDYSGTAAQNLSMIQKLGGSTLTDSYYPACKSTCNSIVDALRSIGVDSSYANRKKIAVKNNVRDYVGTAKQNEQLLVKLKAGKLKM